MARCEDFPCCGHEPGCCPDYENGEQVNMRCTCGAVLPIDNRFSICDSCMDAAGDEEFFDTQFEDEEFDDTMDGDEASGLASAGWGTDEDYGDYGSDEW